MAQCQRRVSTRPQESCRRELAMGVLGTGWLGRHRAHVARKCKALVDQGSGFAVLAEVVRRDRGAKRYAALFRRHDPPTADVPDEDIAAVFLSLDVHVGCVKRLPRQSDVVRQSTAQCRGQPGRKNNLDDPGWCRAVRNRRFRSYAWALAHPYE
jgi:hypothetical protein